MLIAACRGSGGEHEEEKKFAPNDPCMAMLPAGSGKSKPITGRFVRALEVERALNAAVPTPAGNHEAMTSAIMVDTDGDGRPDLVANSSRERAYVARGLGDGRFADSQLIDDEQIGGCSHVVDLDGDGAVDMICDLFSARVRWSDKGVLTGPGALLDAPVGASPMATLAWDVDEDGLLDVVLSPFGSANRVARNRGDRTFELVEEKFGLGVDGLTWATAFVDLDGDGDEDVYVMNDGSNKDNRALRREEPGPAGEPRFVPFVPVAGTCDRHGFFGFGNATPMGLAVADLVGDGSSVLHLANTSPTPILRREMGGLRFVHESMFIQDRLTTTGQFLVPWSPVFWDADHDGVIDLLLPTGDDRGFHDMGGRGESFILFHHGVNAARFEEQHATIGLDTPGHFQTVTLADYDGDGDLDLLAGGFAQHVRVYENQLAAGPHVLASFRGRVSNPHGAGARVRVTADGQTLTYFVGDRFHPQATSVPLIDATLGDAGRAVFEVDWPSGYRQIIREVTAGTRVIEEPPFVAVTPANRHVAADGMMRATIRVRPVDAEGRLMAAKVTIETPFPEAGADAAGPIVAAADGSVSREFVSKKIGSAVVVVTIDGVPVRVRPRIWFDAPPM